VLSLPQNIMGLCNQPNNHTKTFSLYTTYG